MYHIYHFSNWYHVIYLVNNGCISGKKELPLPPPIADDVYDDAEAPPPLPPVSTHPSLQVPEDSEMM